MNAKAVCAVAVAVVMTAAAFAQQTSSPARSRRNTQRSNGDSSQSRTASVDHTTSSANTQAIESAGVHVGYFIDTARSWYEYSGGVLSWKEPGPADTNHVGITLMRNDKAIPSCKVTANLTDESGKDLVSSTTLSFTWGDSPYYGANINVFETTETLTLNVRVEPPDFRRLDKTAGAFFSSAVTCSFKDVKIGARTKQRDAPTTESEKAFILEGRHPAITPTPYPGSK